MVATVAQIMVFGIVGVGIMNIEPKKMSLELFMMVNCKLILACGFIEAGIVSTVMWITAFILPLLVIFVIDTFTNPKYILLYDYWNQRVINLPSFVIWDYLIRNKLPDVKEWLETMAIAYLALVVSIFTGMPLPFFAPRDQQLGVVWKVMLVCKVILYGALALPALILFEIIRFPVDW